LPRAFGLDKKWALLAFPRRRRNTTRGAFFLLKQKGTKGPFWEKKRPPRNLKRRGQKFFSNSRWAQIKSARWEK